MLSNDCKSCKYVVWLIALGQGVRCKHPQNQEYKNYSLIGIEDIKILNTRMMN